MESWIFIAPDTWTRTPPPAVVWPVGEHVSVSMGTLGYRYVQRAGDSRVVSLGFWSLWAAEAPYAYAVLVQAWPQWALVWLPGLPDMLTYLSLYGNVGQGVRGAGEAERLLHLLERAFRAWHGHEVYGACEACDPDEVARLAQGKLPRWMEDPFRPPVVFQKWRLHLLT